MFLVEPDKVGVKDTYILFFLSKMIRGFKGIIKEPQTNEKQTCFCSNLLTSSCVMTYVGDFI